MSVDRLSLLAALAAAYLAAQFCLCTATRRRVPWPRRFARDAAAQLLAAAVVVLPARGWLVVALVALLHAAVEAGRGVLRPRMLPPREQSPGAHLAEFVVVQALHAVLIAAGLLLIADRAAEPAVAWARWFDRGAIAALVAVCGFVVAVPLGADVIGILTAPYAAQLKQPDDGEIRPRGFDDGGRVIGLWERAIIFLLVTTGHVGAVAFLAAAKSIFRFGEIKDHKQRREAEFILIGTLISFSWGLFAGAATSWLQGASVAVR